MQPEWQLRTIDFLRAPSRISDYILYWTGQCSNHNLCHKFTNTIISTISTATSSHVDFPSHLNTGFLLIYAVLPLAVWVMMQIACILLGVYFPFHGQRILMSIWKRRSLHAFSLLLGLVLPVPTVVLLLLKGQSVFGTTFPPIVCISQRRDIMIFTWLIPLSILLSVVITMLVFIFYKVIKVWNHSPTIYKPCNTWVLFFTESRLKGRVC